MVIYNLLAFYWSRVLLKVYSFLTGFFLAVKDGIGGFGKVENMLATLNKGGICRRWKDMMDGLKSSEV